MKHHTARDSFEDRRKYEYPNYYAILGCDRCSSKSQIMAEYRQRVRQLHPDKSLKQVPEIFHELQNAKNILTDDEMKRIYDAWFDCSVDIPWSLWLENFHSLSSIHWTRQVNGSSMLKYRNEEKKVENSCSEGPLQQIFRVSRTVKKCKTSSTLQITLRDVFTVR
ncbi:DnaJ [Dirofilaria immitis]